MPVDVSTEIEIDRPRADVASFASDPDNAVAWYENIRAVEWRSPRPVGVGSRIAFVARLGRRLAYTYEVKEMVAGERFVMSTAEGRNRGVPSGFSRLAPPLMATAMRRANRKDLRRLKSLLEAPGRAS